MLELIAAGDARGRVPMPSNLELVLERMSLFSHEGVVDVDAMSNGVAGVTAVLVKWDKGASKASPS